MQLFSIHHTVMITDAFTLCRSAISSNYCKTFCHQLGTIACSLGSSLQSTL